jgi:two-component system alkaline phosphatase synthesis response regulator PhoP
MAVIYIVEDDKNISEIESFALKNSGYTVCEFDSAGKLYQAMKEKKPNLILLDVMLPDEDGFHVIKKLRSDMASRTIPVIMVTAKTSEMDKVKGLDYGADDYIAKPFGIMELISRVKALLRRSMGMLEEDFLSLGDIFLDNVKHEVSVKGELCDLTFKEFELLRYLMNHAGIVVRRENIRNKVWGEEYEGESRTLDMHIKTLRKKLGEEGSRIKTVRNVGYKLE